MLQSVASSNVKMAQILFSRGKGSPVRTHTVDIKSLIKCENPDGHCIHDKLWLTRAQFGYLYLMMSFYSSHLRHVYDLVVEVSQYVDRAILFNSTTPKLRLRNIYFSLRGYFP